MLTTPCSVIKTSLVIGGSYCHYPHLLIGLKKRRYVGTAKNLEHLRNILILRLRSMTSQMQIILKCLDRYLW